MEEYTKKCPFCGGEINNSAIKCKHCKRFIDDYHKETVINDNKSKGCLKIFIYTICAFICLISLLAMIPTSDDLQTIAENSKKEEQLKRERELKRLEKEAQEKREEAERQRIQEEKDNQRLQREYKKEQQRQQINKELNEAIDYLKGPKCDNQQVQNMVKEIFKQNNPFYLNNTYYVNNIFLQYPVATSYDKSIDKYFCKGTVIVQLTNNTQPYQCNIEYTAQKTSDGFYVESDYCQYDILNYSDF